MKIEDKELLQNSTFQLEKTLELSFSYKKDIKQKILDKNFNNSKKNTHKLFDRPNDDLFIFQIPADLKISIDEFYDNEQFNIFYEEIINIENKELLKKAKIKLEKNEEGKKKVLI